MIPSSSLTAFCVLKLFGRKVGIVLRHRQRFVAQQFLQRPNVHSSHCQMAGAGMPQIVKPEIRNARPFACRCEAVFDIPHVPTVTIAAWKWVTPKNKKTQRFLSGHISM